MSSSNTDEVDNLIRSAGKFLEATWDGERGTSLEWIHKMEESLPANEESDDEEEKLNIFLQKLHEHISRNCEGRGRARKTTQEEEEKHPYWIGKRPLPSVTEDEVDEVVERLTDEERRELTKEFNALKSDEFDVLSTGGTSPGESHNNNNNNRGGGGRDVDTLRFDGPSVNPQMGYGKSMVFGENVCEVTFDNDAWSFYRDPELRIPANNAHGMYTEGMHSFGDPGTNTGGAGPLHEVAFSIPPASPKRRREKETSEYIRSKVRMMLIANRVAKEVEEKVEQRAEEELAGAASHVAENMLKEKCRSLRSDVERSAALLEDAAKQMLVVKKLHREAIGEYVEDPYASQTWQRNETAKGCRCGRAFNFFIMRHHCRRCGLLFCHRCSSYAGKLPDKKKPDDMTAPWLRLCKDCYDMCCKYQRRAFASTSDLPKAGHQKEAVAPDTPFSKLLDSCPNKVEGTLEDKLPPFYVVLPEEWFKPEPTTVLRWMSRAKTAPYTVLENFHDGMYTLSTMAEPVIKGLLATGTNSTQRIT